MFTVRSFVHSSVNLAATFFVIVAAVALSASAFTVDIATDIADVVVAFFI